MNDHSYILKPYKGPASRHICPSCGHRHKFSRYIYSATGNELADHVGRCDREQSCGYHFKPADFFKENPESIPQLSATFIKKESINKPVDYLPFKLMDKSVSHHNKCNLYPFLVKLFTEDISDQICNDYFIGTNKEGDTVFWQVDIAGKVRQCKIIRYLSDGHRNKETAVTFAGKKILNNQDANLKQCFFGEFLLSFDIQKEKSIAIVESEKTAVIASVYFPNFIWLATGGKHGARWTEQNVCRLLAGRKVILFPDLGAYDSWKAKGLLMAATAGCKVVVSDLLEKNASDEDRKNGLDIADYLLRYSDSSELALTDPVDNNNPGYPIIFDYQYKQAV